MVYGSSFMVMVMKRLVLSILETPTLEFQHQASHNTQSKLQILLGKKSFKRIFSAMYYMV